MTTDTMYGVFNMETGQLERGPFSKKGAITSKSAVIDRHVQHEYLQDGKNYDLYLAWAIRGKKIKNNPYLLVDQPEILYYLDGEEPRFTEEKITELIERINHYNDIIQVKEVVINYKL